MLKHYWLKFRKLIIAIGFLLGLWQGIVWALPRISEFLNSLPNSGLQEMTLQTNTILAIFALIVLCIIYVSLPLLFIFKKNKKINFPKLIYETSPNVKLNLPPPNEIKKIIKFIVKNKKGNRKDLINNFGYSDTKAELYIELLWFAHYIKRYYSVPFNPLWVYFLPFSEHTFFTTTRIGKRYAIDNNLDQHL